MKKILSAFVVLLSGTLSAQITITSTDMPSLGDTVRLSTTFDQWSIDPTLTGSNYTWDFSYLVPQSQSFDTFKSVTSTPFAYQYFFNNQIQYPDHKANYAVRGEDFGVPGYFEMTEVYNFYKNNNDQYKHVGFGAKMNGIPMSVRNIPIDTIYQFPLTDPGAYTSFSSYELEVPGTFYYRQRKWVTAETDGYGTVITPLGSFQAVRVKLLIDIEDSIYVDGFGFGFTTNRPQETQYHWLANGESVPVLQINEINGNITTIIYKDLPASFNDVNEETSENNFQLFPNPASDFITISSADLNGRIEIFGYDGKLIRTYDVNNTSSKMLYTGDLPSGIYMIRYSNNGNVLSKRFVISR
jgi:hypothetical protein